MIYISDTTIIPKVQDGIPNGLKLINQVTKEELLFDDISDEGSYYIVTISDELAIGQYDYFMLEGEKILSNGIAQYGEYERTKTDYSNDITIKTYK